MKTKPNTIQFYFPYKDDIYSGENILLAKAYYKKSELDLINGERISCNGKERLDDYLDINLGVEQDNLNIVHLFYEYSISESCDDNTLLGIVLEFSHINKTSLLERKFSKYSITKQWEYFEYQEQFEIGRQHLLRGDCYQYNLTMPYRINLENQMSFFQVLSNIWHEKSNRGAYGHGTYIPLLRKGYISNSPECLFQIKQNDEDLYLETMPIKGTIKLHNKNEDQYKKWEELKACPKNQAELFMIVDLLKNDLAKINAHTTNIMKLKAPLMVPGILHQYSKVAVRTNKDLNLKDVITSLFPGGSITGAPKKRVIEIIQQLEKRKRGLYCGSTVIMHKKLKAASINIRTADMDLSVGHIDYQAGGGITLLSEVEAEWNEAILKTESFSRLL